MSEPDIAKTRLLPPEARDLQMPDGTPLGLGFLGAAKFAAIRRVIDIVTRATEAKANLIDAQWRVGSAMIRREVVLEQLDNLDLIRSDEANRIRIAHEARLELAEIEKLKRKVERMELEDQVATKEAVRRKAAGLDQTSDKGVAKDEFAELFENIKRLPEVQKAAATAREQIIKDAGGEEKLTEAGRQSLEMVDVMISAFMQKRAMGEAT